MLYLARGDVGGAARYAQELCLPTADEVVASTPFRIPRSLWGHYFFLSRLLLSQRRHDAALVVAEAMRELTGRGPNRVPLRLVEVAVLEALAWQVKGDTIKATERLTLALDLAEPPGLASSFIESGEPMARLLRRALASGIHPAFARKLLEAITAEAGNYVGLGAPLDSPTPQTRWLPEPLTEREIQVLRLLSLGLTSTEVAEELVISVQTTRSYMKTIYRKLDVHSRREAVEAGEHAGLI